MTDDFVSSRRRIIGWYADPRWTAYCGVCGVRLGTCNCATTPAGATHADVTSTHAPPTRIELPPPLPAGVVNVPSVFSRQYACPVCDYVGFDENPLDRTFDICPQCGIEFGYHDISTPHTVLRARIANALALGYKQDGAWWIHPDGKRTSVDGLPYPTVSLPEATPTQLEDTQAEDEPPPSGWRDRPALL
jgi:hypothetical protein